MAALVVCFHTRLEYEDTILPIVSGHTYVRWEH